MHLKSYKTQEPAMWLELCKKQIYKPTLGMLFDSHEEMFTFYKAYGKQEGCIVKVRST